MGFPVVRLRRLRQSAGLRCLVNEHRLALSDLVLPLFIREGKNVKHPIGSMPGHYQYSVDTLLPELMEIDHLGITAVILFGIPNHKDAWGSGALDATSVIPQAIRYIKQQLPNLLVIADLCLCAYTSHGHCGILTADAVDGDVVVDNDKTLDYLGRQAVLQAEAGAEIIAPSGMMDGVIGHLRRILDQQGFQNVLLLSYAVKYASALYGPFREAAEGAPSFGDRKTYQMNPANVGEALREAALDVEEGTDMLMVKPALPYLDVIHRVKQQFPGVPLAAYQVSGEFAMIKAAAAQGWINETAVFMESLLSIKRAGANFIVTYFAKQAADILVRDR